MTASKKRQKYISKWKRRNPKKVEKSRLKYSAKHFLSDYASVGECLKIISEAKSRIKFLKGK